MPRSRRLGLPDPAKRFTEIPQRRVPQLEFGIRLPTFRANLFGTVTVANISETPVTWGDWENGDTRFFGETLIGSPARLQKVSLLVPGVYSIMACLHYTASFTATRHVIFLDDHIQDPLISCRAAHYGPDMDSFTYGDTLQVVRGFPVFTSDELIFGIVGRVFIKANQDSGVARDLDEGILEIYYLGGFSVLSEEL